MDERLSMLAPDRGAELSPCGRYRYTLWRRWAEGPRCLFVMLNPSTADATRDDPTIRRCIGFARRWGHGSLEVVNLFAWRATDPAVFYQREAWHDADPIGPENDRAILAAVGRAATVIAAWGMHGELMGRGAAVEAMITRAGVDLWCLGITRKGYHPRHPLYLATETSLQLFAQAAEGEEVRHA
jgi:hypothetical protein